MIKNTTIYNESSILALNHHTTRKHRRWFIFSILLLAFLFIETTYNRPNGFWIFITFYVLLTLFLIGSMGFTLYTNKRRLQSTSGVLNTTLFYSFDDDNCKILVSKPSNEENTLVFSYVQIKRVVETRGYLFVYISSSSSLILDKQGFEKEEEDLDRLKILLTKKRVKITT